MRHDTCSHADFFVSRRSSVAPVATEVADVLIAHGYTVVVQDYDMPVSANFAEAMHEAIKTARNLLVLWTADYDTSPHTRREFTSFYAASAGDPDRRMVVLRCEDVPLPGLLAPIIYQDLIGIHDPEERKRRILAAASGVSLSAVPMPPPFHGVPPRIRTFTGRIAALEALDAILAGGNRPAAVVQTGSGIATVIQAGTGIAAVHGLGGVGKTSLAVEYAYRYRPLYAGVWWCSAETPEGLLQALAALGTELGVRERSLERTAEVTLDRLAEHRVPWLLIYDNVPSPDAITSLLPRAGASVVITSRFPDWQAWAEELPLDILPPDEAVTFLQKRGSRSDAPGAALLARTLGYLPLALDHAAAYCRSTGSSFTGYASQVARLMAEVPSGTAYPRSVAATFDLAIAQAVQRCPHAEVLMAFIAFAAPEPMPLILLNGAVNDPASRDAALSALADVSLLRHDSFGNAMPAVSVHRMVQLVGRKRAEANGLAKKSIARLIAQLKAAYPSPNHRSSSQDIWNLSQQLIPHVLFLYTQFYSNRRLARIVKRATDILFASILLLTTAPIMLLAAIAIKLDSPGPIIYRQRRVGLHGKPFIMLKFRSMKVDAEADSKLRWSQQRDPRLTLVGCLIRLMRIDELPQLLNVLVGDMSVVGPRPERPHFVEQLSRVIPFYHQRAYVKPGITGWAQVNYPYGASVEDAREKIAYDLYYVTNRSTLLDLRILLATVRVILFREGAR